MMVKPVALSNDAGLLSPDDFARIEAAVSEAVAAAWQRSHASSRKAERSDALREEAPPANNMGGKSPDIAARLVLEDGEVLEIPARRGWGGDAAFVDWINYTAHEDAYWVGESGSDTFNNSFLTANDIVDRISAACFRIFGFGILAERPTGANFYKRSFVLGEGCGMVCYGGQRNTVLVMLSGTGCAAAAPGWEKRLHDWLEDKARFNARITRVDLAHDDYTGSRYSVDAANSDFDNGLFTNGGRTPDCEFRGNWKKPNGKGRTFYVGHRSNGKFARIYEKGRELGDKSSDWCRIEVELKSVDRIIPNDVLLLAGAYLAATYPAFAWISDRQERILTEQKKTQITYDAMCAWLKKQCGAALNVVRHIEGGAEAALAKIVRDEIPARLTVPSYLFGGDWLHDRKRETLPVEASVCAW